MTFASILALAGASVTAAQVSETPIVDRYRMTADQAAALREAASAAVSRGGRVVAEEGPATISEPAGGAFVRNQMIAAATFYGPAAA